MCASSLTMHPFIVAVSSIKGNKSHFVVVTVIYIKQLGLVFYLNT